MSRKIPKDLKTLEDVNKMISTLTSVSKSMKRMGLDVVPSAGDLEDNNESCDSEDDSSALLYVDCLPVENEIWLVGRDETPELITVSERMATNFILMKLEHHISKRDKYNGKNENNNPAPPALLSESPKPWNDISPDDASASENYTCSNSHSVSSSSSIFTPLPPSDLSETNNSTTGKRGYDSRTFTRPKKDRTSFATSFPSTVESPDGSTISGSVTMTRKTKLGNALKFAPAMNANEGNYNKDRAGSTQRNDSTITKRHVSRNMSYVVHSRGSQSPNNNQNVYEFPARTTTDSSPNLNYTSSPSGSNSSLNNISMEELQNIARRQEESLNSAVGASYRSDRNSMTNVQVIGRDGDSPESSNALDFSSKSRCLNSNRDDGNVGRSMPDLAMKRYGYGGSQTHIPQLTIPSNSLKLKNVPHHISDTKLSSIKGAGFHDIKLATHTSKMSTKLPSERSNEHGYGRPPMSSLPKPVTSLVKNGDVGSPSRIPGFKGQKYSSHLNEKK